MMKNPIILRTALMTFLVASAPLRAATTLYNLSGLVLDGSGGENTYVSATGTGSGLNYNAGTPSLTWTLSNSNSNYSQLIGKFAATSLANVGDSITLSYSFTASVSTAFNNTDGAFRVGLFNSNGSVVTGNTAGTDGNVNSDLGYAAFYRPNTGTNAASNTFGQRTGTSAVLMSTSAIITTTTPFGTTAPTLSSFGITTGNLTGTGSFTLTLLTGGSVRLTSVVNSGGGQTRDDTVSAFVTTFDEFGFFATSGSTANPALTFTDLSVVYAAVPEPSTYALFVGAGGLAFVAWRRRGGLAKKGIQGL